MISLLAQTLQLPSSAPQSTGPAVFQSPSISWWGISPILVLVVGTALILTFTSLSNKRLPAGAWSFMGTVVGGLSLAATIILWAKIDSGHQPFSTGNNALSIDGFAVFFFGLLSVAVIMTSLVAETFLENRNLERREFYLLMFLSAAGGMTMAAAGDLIVLFVGLEILSIALYVMTGFDRGSKVSREAALKYFLLGALASALFIYGSSLLYGATGSTNFREMASYLANTTTIHSGILIAGMFLVLIGLAFKVSLVPFHMWTPDVYEGAITPATGFMAAAAKAAGFAGLLRVFFVVFDTRSLDWHPVIWTLALITLLVGPVLAIMQKSVKRMLAYSSISHAGYILLGLVAGTQKGIEGSLFYLLAYTFIVLGSFAVVATVAHDNDDSLDRFNGLSDSHPVLALVFAVLLFAQAGVPLTSGFLAKFGVIAAAVQQRSYAIAIVAMVLSVVAAFAYLRVVVRMYMQSGEEQDEIEVEPPTSLALTFAIAATLLLGILPQIGFNLVHGATIHL